MIRCGTIYVHFLTRENAVDLHGFGLGLLVAGKGSSALPSVNYCQGQLQTAQLVTLRCCVYSAIQ